MTVNAKMQSSFPAGTFPARRLAAVDDRKDRAAPRDEVVGETPKGKVLILSRNKGPGYEFKWKDGGELPKILKGTWSSHYHAINSAKMHLANLKAYPNLEVDPVLAAALAERKSEREEEKAAAAVPASQKPTLSLKKRE